MILSPRITSQKHIDSCESWPHGEVARFWLDDDDNLCIQYDDGEWWQN